jgi:enoyl-CoA hydratase/carnithine racemase
VTDTAPHALDHVLAEIRNGVGVLSLNRPHALNAITLGMIRSLTAQLLAWRDDASVKGVLVQGAKQEGKGAAFCAGGDIRFFHQAALAGNPELEDFFTEEYALDHLIHCYPKPYVALMDGVVMGGGMGISQGAALRVVTERTRMAMPETNIGLFPDVGGGWFLSRCPGHVGEYLALTGQVIGAGDAIHWGLADGYLRSDALPALHQAIGTAAFATDADWLRFARSNLQAMLQPALASTQTAIDRHFSHATVAAILASLQEDGSTWALETVNVLGKRSPLMLAVALEQIHRARGMGLADELRMERGMMRHCFHLRPGAASEAVEGVRALAVDKDQRPRWNPATVADVSSAMVQAFFRSPWPPHAHPLRSLT